MNLWLFQNVEICRKPHQKSDITVFVDPPFSIRRQPRTLEKKTSLVILDPLSYKYFNKEIEMSSIVFEKTTSDKNIRLPDYQRPNSLVLSIHLLFFLSYLLPTVSIAQVILFCFRVSCCFSLRGRPRRSTRTDIRKYFSGATL